MKKLALLPMLILLLPACINMSSYQTAQVAADGEKFGTMALTMTSVAPSQADQDVIYEDISFVTPEFMLRAGIGNNMDIGLRTWLAFPFLGLAADFKYQFIDSAALDLSFDIGASYFGIETIDSDLDFLDIMPALMITLPSAGITITPKQIYRSISGVNTANDSQVYTGASISIALGSKGNIIPEVGIFEGEGNRFTYYGLGIRF